MKEKVQKFSAEIGSRVKQFFGKKRNIILVVILVAVVLIVSLRDNREKDMVSDTIKRQDLLQTVLASGQVTSVTDLNLSFTTSGVIKNISVRVGQKVKKGDLLATLEQGNELGALTSARGALLAAEAKYQKIIDGASSEEITLAEVALKNAIIDLENTKIQQEGLVQNAYRALLSNDLQATQISSSGTTTDPTISGTYTGLSEGVYSISGYSTGGGGYFSISGSIENGTGLVSTTKPTPLGTKGLYIQFVSGSTVGQWEVAVPNKKSATYVTYLNAYQSAIETKNRTIATAQSLVDEKQASLTLKKASARQADIDLAKADVLSAQGQYQNALASFEKTVLRAPSDGVITDVAFTVGEQIQALEKIVTLQDIDNLYIEGIVNESRVSQIVVGQSAQVVYDAFGKDKIFTGKVISVDPGATLDDGVANYKVNIALDEKSELIRPGMNATFTLIISKKENVLTVPGTAIIKKDTGSVVLRLNEKKKRAEIPVTTGMVGDGNLVEIVSGLTEGETVVVNPDIFNE